MRCLYVFSLKPEKAEKEAVQGAPCSDILCSAKSDIFAYKAFECKSDIAAQ